MSARVKERAPKRERDAKRQQRATPFRAKQRPHKAEGGSAKRHEHAAALATQKLQKVLAQAGLGSRRNMEEWIREGRVTVNGKVAGIGTRVSPDDHIKVGTRIVRFATSRAVPRVLLYHKPEGEIVTRDDPEGRPSVFDKLPGLRNGKWLAIGRLDFNTSGLLLFTDSGELANRLMHPRYEMEREYAVRILGQLSTEQMTRLRKGVELADGTAQCLWIEEEGGEGSNRWYRLAVREGRNRVVRRLFEALSLTVSRLIRVRFGPVALPPRLRRGQLMELPAPEVKRLLDSLERPQPDPAPVPRG